MYIAYLGQIAVLAKWAYQTFSIGFTYIYTCTLLYILFTSKMTAMQMPCKLRYWLPVFPTFGHFELL